MDPIQQARYRAKVRGGQCPMPGCRRPATDWHHALARRDPDHPYLYDECNMTMVCHFHHVPEAPELGYWCMIYKFTKQGLTPEAVEAWVENAPFKTPIVLPEFYYTARQEVFGY